MTEGHAQELKTQALALGVGKRLRVILSDNNAGIDDSLLGGVIPSATTRLQDGRAMDVLWLERLRLDDGGDYGQIVGASRRWKIGIRRDRRPMIAIAKTTKGYWPAAMNGKLTRHGQADRELSEPSLCHEDELGLFRRAGRDLRGALRREFEGIRNGPVTDERERLIQFKTNIDVVMSVLDKNGLGRLGGGPAGHASATRVKDD